MKIKIFLLTLCGVIALVRSQCLSENDIEVPPKDTKSNLYKGEMQFTLNLLQALNEATPNENIFFSPYSIFHASLLAYFGSRGKSEELLKSALQLQWSSNRAHVMQAYRIEKSNRAARSVNSSVEFVSADRIYVDNKIEVRDCMKDSFEEELKSLDFNGEPESSRKSINEWIETFTKGHIKDILPEGSITSNTKLALANAAYFKGTWNSKFDPENTKRELFYKTTQNFSFVDMMHLKGSFYHATNENLGAHILEMPYDGDEMSMFVLLPPMVDNGLENLLARLTLERLEETLQSGVSREVILSFPKFKLEQTVELVPIMSKIGAGELFNPNIDLSGISETTKLSLDDAIHKSVLEVDENGSTAASATVLFSFRSSRPAEPAKFECNHPFVFYIYDNKSKAILFSGIYRDPQIN